MKVAIVILNWNGLDLLKKFLPTVVKLSSDTGSIYLADNASGDNSLNWVSENYPEVRIISLESNFGFAGGYNHALDKIDAEYYILLNSDVEVSEGWLDPLISFMDIEKGVAACQPKILSYRNRNYFEHAGAAGGFIDKFGYPYCRGRIFAYAEMDNGQYDTIRDIFWASGACLCIRSAVWKEAGGFDQDFFAHMEEIDLCWRINSLGYRIVAIPDSVVYHLGGGTLPYSSPTKVYYNFRNSLYLLYKNLPLKGRLTTLFFRKILDGIAAIKFLLSFEFKAFYAVLRAHISYYGAKKKLNEKRKLFSIKNARYPEHLILNKSIALNYFLRSKKQFTDNLPQDKEL